MLCLCSSLTLDIDFTRCSSMTMGILNHNGVLAVIPTNGVTNHQGGLTSLALVKGQTLSQSRMEFFWLWLGFFALLLLLKNGELHLLFGGYLLDRLIVSQPRHSWVWGARDECIHPNFITLPDSQAILNTWMQGDFRRI